MPTPHKQLLRASLPLFILAASADLLPARSSWVDRIPNGAVNSCSTCHPGGNTGQLNSFANDFHDVGVQWTSALRTMDSDGDGAPNYIELQDLNQNWSQGQPAPGNPALVTRPGDASSVPPTPTPTPTATPTPTETPIPTPTASPSPTPAEGQTVYTTSFVGGANGWEVVDLAGGPFNLASFTTPEGAIALSANGSANCFGFWKSPRIAVVGGHRMVVRWVVRSSSADTLTPAFRLRATDGAFRYSQFIAIESPSGGVAPGTDEKVYEMVYDVPADASEMELAFDITSFTPTDDLIAVLELREVSVRRQ